MGGGEDQRPRVGTFFGKIKYLDNTNPRVNVLRKGFVHQNARPGGYRIEKRLSLYLLVAVSNI